MQLYTVLIGPLYSDRYYYEGEEVEIEESEGSVLQMLGMVALVKTKKTTSKSEA